MSKIFAWAEALARSDAPVLLTGESGTGKTELALALHSTSKRRLVCCLRLTGLSADELRLALVGSGSALRPAADAALGMCRKGTLILQDIAALNPTCQSILLGCIGGGLRIPYGNAPCTRIISTSPVEMQSYVRQGRFRGDLYHRLAGGTIAFPPLRRRVADIELLARSFLEGSPSSKAGEHPHLTADAIDLLMGYPWPGNVRELRSVVELAALAVRGGAITHHAIGQLVGSVEAPPAVAIPIGTSLAQAERLLISATLGATAGNRQDAATVLRISRRTLYQKLEMYRKKGAEPNEFPSQRQRFTHSRSLS